MEKSNNLGWLGILTLLSGLFQLVGSILYMVIKNDYDSALFFPAGVFDLVGSVFIVFSIFAIFFYHSLQGGFNKFSFFFGIFASTLFVGQSWVRTFVEPFVHEKAPKLLETDPGFPLSLGFTLTFLLFTIGLILAGIVVIKAKKITAWAGFVLIIAPIIDFLPFNLFGLGQLLFSLVLIYLGTKFYKARLE
jgi:hypothetical protein